MLTVYIANWIAENVAVLPVIDSTNQYLLIELASWRSGDACAAEYQQAGRGRRGVKWFSPFGANLYLQCTRVRAGNARQ